jgi:hypothetical protein
MVDFAAALSPHQRHRRSRRNITSLLAVLALSVLLAGIALPVHFQLVSLLNLGAANGSDQRENVGATQPRRTWTTADAPFVVAASYRHHSFPKWGREQPQDKGKESRRDSEIDRHDDGTAEKTSTSKGSYRGSQELRREELGTIHSRIISSRDVAVSDGRRKNLTRLWDVSLVIPPWMKRYFAWHEKQRSSLTSENWRSKRYLVLRCLSTDAKCGGASDRLNALPYLLMLANQTNRLFFMTWSRPAPLEEFLVPPKGGLNWSIPSAVDFSPYLIGRRNIRGRAKSSTNETGIIAHKGNAYWANTDLFFVEARMAGAPPKSTYDDCRESTDEAPFERVFRDVWQILFEPSPNLVAIIGSTQRRLGLTEGLYVSAHVRAQYKINANDNTAIVRNAIHCASTLYPGAPVFVGSDSTQVANYAVQYGKTVLNHSVFARMQEGVTLHIDRGKSFLSHADADWNEYPASAYFDTFVDMYLLSGAKCVTYGIGGYGYWTSMMSGNVSCSMRHTVRNCSWTPKLP